MKIMIITSSPNKDGLTATCGEHARQGVVDAGAEAVMVSLNERNIPKCYACGNGWGTCREGHICQMPDDFQALHKAFGEVDGYIVITPVYWGEMSETAKAFFDRLRRCEALTSGETIMQNKPVLSVAAAGGSGNGIITCLTQMERLFLHMRAQKFDLIGINRRNRHYMLEAIKAAANTMALGK